MLPAATPSHSARSGQHRFGIAGRQLAAALTMFRGEAVVVLGLASGGVPVAAQVATELNPPLDVVVVRKQRPSSSTAASRRTPRKSASSTAPEQ